jgi:glycosyltransferase involved in cell wall biosynthesis
VSQTQPISVVVCTKNEESRLEACLQTIAANSPDEIIVVDGDSKDNTRVVASRYTERVVHSKNSNLTRDRQIGLDAAKNDLIAMIDSDHRLNPSDLKSLLADMNEFDLDIVQGQLVAPNDVGFWAKAESDAWSLVHNLPGPKTMIGTAPCIYKKKIFDLVKFDDHITSSIDDTDFMYRLSHHKEIRIGIGRTQIMQYHFADFDEYRRKFIWYGRGDGQFCRKHPERAASMFYHLLVRYPIIYSLKALVNLKFRAMPFFIFQGWVRFYGLLKGLRK